ncbi:MAG: glycosyltransferase [Rikenellaceae bacterium]
MKIQNQTPIAILLATYNGELYLPEQLESILSQTCQDFTIYIQDDGSSDNTQSIINEYVNKHSNIVSINNGLTRQGASLNFMNLLNCVDSEYYMFADQDDVWLPFKIETSVNRMHKVESELGGAKSVPIIIHTDRTYTDDKLNITRQSEFNHSGKCKDVVAKIEALKNHNIISIYTTVGGCTMLINRFAKEISFPYINIRMHDATIAMSVSAHKDGIISTIYESTMLYRQHSSNTCGVNTESRLSKFKKLHKVISNNMMGFYIWKVYGRGSFFKFLYYRIKYYFIYYS